MLEKMYITTLEKPNERYHRSKIIIHRGSQFYLAEFHNLEQLKDFMDFAEITMQLEEEKPYFKPDCGIWKRYSVKHTLENDHSFWKLSDIPDGAKKFKGLSNGSIVDCYLLNDGKTIHIYRPNPNAKEVYRPISIEEHIKWQSEHGII